MSHRRRLLVVACLVLTGVAAEAGPAKRHPKRTRRVTDEVEVNDGSARAAARAELRRMRAAKRKLQDAEAADEHVDAPEASPETDEPAHERTAFASPADDVLEDSEEAEPEDLVDEAEPDVQLHASRRSRRKDWQVAIGPYLWASSVDADVSLGPTSVGTGIGFGELQRHARYGAEVLADARYGRFSLASDLMYGVVGVNGAKDVGPLMVTLDGTASSLLLDGMAGYRVLGRDDSWFAAEARGGVRYQRTAIAGSIDVSGNKVSPPMSVDTAVDALAGARVFLRPWSRFYVSSAVDIRVAGNSNSTWSAAADASVRITSHVLFSVGWRTLTTDRAHVSVVMHGPRAALQFVF